MGFGSRLPNSNDSPRPAKNRWGAQPGEALDDTALLLNGLAGRCAKCRRVTKKGHLVQSGDQKLCPDCRD